MATGGRLGTEDATELSRRFDKYVEPEPMSGCWLWVGARVSFGHGAVTVNGHQIAAHRASWLLHRGSIPPGSWVLHKCDVPCCVNPVHLYLGTPADNTHDALVRGRLKLPVADSLETHPERIPRGERRWNAKLTAHDVAEIRRQASMGIPCRVLAAKYEVSKATVSQIVHRKSWCHVLVNDGTIDDLWAQVDRWAERQEWSK